MLIRTTIAGAAIAISSVAAAQNTPVDRAEKVISKLEVLNSLGMDCESHLQVSGMEGSQSKPCQKFLKNAQGAYMTGISGECGSLSEWYEVQRQEILANPKLADDEPAKAAEMVKGMKAVQAACHPDSLASYKYLMKPLDTIQALSELE